MKPTSSNRKNRVLIVGGGNAAHVFVGRCGSLGMDVDWLTTYGQEAQRLRLASKEHGGVSAVDTASGERWYGRPQRISGDPKTLVPDSRIIIMTLPAFAQEDVLNRIAPYVEDGTCIGAVPGYPSLDLIMHNALGARKSQTCTFFGTRTLPWACRIQDYGKTVSIFGTKKTDQIVVSKPKNQFILSLFQEIVGGKIRYETINTFLFLSFTMPWHPCFIYGMFKDWDGVTPYSKVPPFYRSVSRETASFICETSNEVLSLKNRITDLFPSIDLSSVVHAKEWLREAYGRLIPHLSLSDLHSMIISNPVYHEGLLFPMLAVDGGYVPDFSSRYLTEDVPFILVVHLALAEMVGVPMPKIERLVQWCQMVMGKEYLVDGKLRGRDICETRAPQRYGFSVFATFAKEMGYI